MCPISKILKSAISLHPTEHQKVSLKRTSVDPPPTPRLQILIPAVLIISEKGKQIVPGIVYNIMYYTRYGNSQI